MSGSSNCTIPSMGTNLRSTAVHTVVFPLVMGSTHIHGHMYITHPCTIFNLITRQKPMGLPTLFLPLHDVTIHKVVLFLPLYDVTSHEVVLCLPLHDVTSQEVALFLPLHDVTIHKVVLFLPLYDVTSHEVVLFLPLHDVTCQEVALRL